MLHFRAATPVASHARSGAILARPTVEFLVILSLSILVFRTFAAEAYIVPTGSMAPTLLGDHEEIVCPNCAIRFALGVDEDSPSARPLCPNCGTAVLDRAAAVACSGDRVLVQKFVYDLRPPERWEVAVFHNPSDPAQALCRSDVVGLPEQNRSRSFQGDVWIDGRIARKTLRDQRAMRIPVYDNNFVPQATGPAPSRGAVARQRAGRGSACRAAGVPRRLLIHEPPTTPSRSPCPIGSRARPGELRPSTGSSTTTARRTAPGATHPSPTSSPITAATCRARIRSTT